MELLNKINEHRRKDKREQFKKFDFLKILHYQYSSKILQKNLRLSALAQLNLDNTNRKMMNFSMEYKNIIVKNSKRKKKILNIRKPKLNSNESFKKLSSQRALNKGNKKLPKKNSLKKILDGKSLPSKDYIKELDNQIQQILKSNSLNLNCGNYYV